MTTLPIIIAPSSIIVVENSLFNDVVGVSVSDPDGDDLTVSLSAEGVLSLGQTTGLSFTSGDGTLDSLIVFSGSISDINAALAGLTFNPANGDIDGDTIAITVTETTGTAGDFPAVFELSLLPSGDGSEGFVLNGLDDFDSSGISVSSAGDINGDGFGDIIIGAPFGDPGGDDRAGEAYIVFGTDQGFDPQFELSSLNGSNGFVVLGLDEYDNAGISVASAGDINGDGFDDILVGADRADPGGEGSSGETYVIFGTDQGFSAGFTPSNLNGSNGFVINGIDIADFSGRSVSGAGDINGDGVDDIVIGATGADPAGEVYVVFGSTSGFSSSFNLSSLNGSNGFTINGIDGSDGVTAGDQIGAAVASAGDFNGDGIDDLIIGAQFADPGGNESAGETYIVFGSSSGYGANFNLSSLNGSNGFILNGADEFDASGRVVSSAGDINGDGFDDVIIGAFDADPNGTLSAGETYVVFGTDQNLGTNVSLANLNGATGFVINGIDAFDQSGQAVSGAGDLNGDGIDDLIIGAPNADAGVLGNAGESYVIFGTTQGFGASFDLANLDGTNGFIINGINAGDGSGTSVSAAGDVNGDGIGDLIIGAPGGDPDNDNAAGETYILFGRVGSTSTTVNDEIDVTIVDSEVNQITGGAGGDTLNGTEFEDFISGLDGDDTIFGDESNDIILGGNGNDILTGNSGNDEIFGEVGIDNLNGGDGNDLLDGGAGNDTLIGGNGEDNLIGGDGFDTLNGGNGNDTIFGGAGLDTLNGGRGDDVIDGGAGNDVIQGADGADLIEGGDGADTINGGTGQDTIFGESGLDTINGGSGTDIINGGLSADTILGGGDSDILNGDEANDNLTGGGGSDRLNGGTGNDILNGDSSSDILNGGSGADIINGGGSNDVLTGGSGADTFTFNLGTGIDRITDFENDIDLIDFSNFALANDITDVMDVAFQIGSSVRLIFNAANVIILEDTNLTDLSASDFIF